MKKLITAIALAGALVFNANALITISWSVQDSGGSSFWLYDTAGGWPGSGAGSVGNNWVCQLVDNGTSAINASTLLTAYQGGTWNQGTVLDSNAFDGTAETPGFADAYAADNSFSGHYLYVRFFNNTSSEAGFIYQDSWVTGGADSGLTVNGNNAGSQGTIMTAGGPALGLASADISSGDGSPGFTTVQPIPEPTSLALFGLGAVLIAARRKFRKA